MNIICTDEDYIIAETLSKIYLHHALYMYKVLPGNYKHEKTPAQKRFLELMPSDKEFTRSEAIELAKSLNRSERHLDRYLKTLLEKGLLIGGSNHGTYIKPKE